MIHRQEQDRVSRKGEHASFVMIATSALIMMVAAVSFAMIGGSDDSSADPVTSGTCGNDVTWTYDTETGTLTISGTGAMSDIVDINTAWGGNTIRSVIISNGVTSVGKNAFFNRNSLESVTIGDSVTSIGDQAFSTCPSLSSVTFGSSLLSIGMNAFERCTSLTTVTFPDSVTGIGAGSFWGCRALTTVNMSESVKGIGSSAFRDCTSLTSFYIPDSVTSFQTLALAGDTALTSITVGGSNTMMTSVDGVLFNKEMTDLWMYPAAKSSTAYTVPSGVKYISSDAFKDNHYVTSITLPDTLENVMKGGKITRYAIQSNAFENCTALESIYLPSGVTYINEAMFRGCTSLASVTYENSVVGIGREAFKGCTSLESLTIPGGTETFATNMVEGCSSLTTLTVPGSVVSIGGLPFIGCSSLTAFIVNASNPSYSSSDGLLLDKAGTTLVYCPEGKAGTSFTIPNGITTIGNNAFSRNATLESVTIQGDVTTIGNYAFYQCTSLTAVNLSENVKTLGDYAFASCSGLTSVDIPSGVTSLSNTCFNRCTSLAAINIDPENELFSSNNGVVFNKDGTTLVWYPMVGTTYAIPVNTTIIGDYAFSGHSALTTVYIPSTVTTIGSFAFDGCTGLTSITIPASVTSIGRYAFRNCTELTSLTIPGTVTAVGGHAFEGCSGITSLTLSEGITNLGDEKTFAECRGLTSVTIPASLTSLGSRMFAYCSGLESVTLPSTISELNSTFYQCTSLESIVIPDGITVLSGTFYGCSALRTVIIPDSVTTIGNDTFLGCPAIEHISFGNGLTSVSAHTNAPAFSVYFYDAEDNILNVKSGNAEDYAVNAERLKGHTFVLIGGKLIRGSYVSFETNGGNDIERVWVKEGNTVSAPNNPVRDYYTFSEWCSDEGLTSAFDFDTAITAGRVLYAKWTPVDFSISYNLDGGDNAPGNPSKINVESEFLFLDPNKTGYNFMGWYANEGFTGEPITGIALGTHENKSLYARWEIKTCTISFDSQGGTPVTPITQNFGTQVIAPANPTKTGHSFVKWQLDGVDYSFTTMPAEDIELDAVWSINNYIIQFDTDGGTEIANKTLAYGAEISVAAPTKTGYTFAGWNPALPGTMPANDLSVTATWTANTHTVTYNENGGVEIEPGTLSVTYGEQYNLTAPTHTDPENNRFAGWKLNEDIIPMSGVWSIDSDVVLVAQWSAIQYYEVIFVGGDGTVGSMNALREESGQEIDMPACAFTKTGYDFTVWKISDGDTTYEADDPYTVTADVTFIAQWALKSYSIHYKLDNAELDAGNYTGNTGTYTNTVTVLPTFPKTGYDVTAWTTTDVAVNDNQFTMPAKEVTFTATSSPHRYTLTLMIEDGTPGSVFATYGAKTSSFTSASRTGYNITGYKVNDLTVMDANGNLLPSKGEYTDASGNWIKASDVTLTADIDPIASDLTVYFKDTAGNDVHAAYDQMYDYGVAYSIHSPEIVGYSPDKTDVTGVMGLDAVIVTVTYTPNRYTITFDSNGGTLVSPITEDYGANISAPSNPTKTGYNFGGWKKNNENYVIPATMPAENVTLVASWTIKEITITFNTGGGTAIAPITQNYNTDVSAPSNPTRTGYTFERWSPSIPAKMPANDMTISAVWNANQYEISFDCNGGTPIDTLVALYDAEISAPSDPTRTGYTFVQWTKAGEPYVFPATMPGENIALVASWNINKYTISFDSNGGSSQDAMILDYGSAIAALPNPTRDGYVFVEWTKAGARFTLPTTMPAGDFTLVASWNELKTTENAIEISDKTDTVVINTSADAMETFLADETKTEVDVKGDGWQMSIPKEIISGTTGPVSVGAKIMTESERSALPQDIQDRIAGKTVYSLSLSDTSGKVTFTGKSIKVSLPYTLKDGENASDVKVFYIDDSNVLHEVSAKYDTSIGCAVFETDHFSNWFVDVVPDESGSGGFNIGLIIGIVVAVLVVAAVAAFFVLKKTGKIGGGAGSA